MMDAEERKRRQKESGKRWRDRNKAHIADKNAQFYAANREREKARAQEWRLENKDQCKAVTKAWREANPERFAQMKREWRLANPEKVKAQKARGRVAHLITARKYKAANKIRCAAKAAEWMKAHPEKNRANASAWARKYPERANARTMARHAAKLNATPAWADREKIKAFYAEAVRLTRETGIRHEVDHIYPLRSKWMCGLHVETNLQILTESENCSKGNRRWPNMAADMLEAA